MARTTESTSATTRGAPLFETLERRTLMSGSPVAISSAAMDSFSGSSDAYTFALHPVTHDTDTASRPLRATASDLDRSAAELDRLGTTPLVNSAPSKTPIDANIFSAVRINGVATMPTPASTGISAKNRTGTSGETRAVSTSDTQIFADRPDRGHPEPPLTATQRHVLLVEDNHTSRLALTAILRSRGLRVTPAETLAEGMRQLASKPDEVIVDLMLPDGDGATLLKYVRDKHLPMRVTVTTAVSDAPRLERVRQLHPDSLLTKPLDVPRLMEALSA